MKQTNLRSDLLGLIKFGQTQVKKGEPFELNLIFFKNAFGLS